MFELMESFPQNPIIKVIGVGGGGSNAVKNMINAGIEGVDFLCINTDVQALKEIDPKLSIQIGCNLTKGLGAGTDPEIGRQAAMEDRERIQEAIEGTDMLFITVGMGGGTGTGAAPIIAQIAKKMGVLTVAIVTKPFAFERKKRMDFAEKGIENLGQYVDSLITVPNEKLIPVLGKHTPVLEVFVAGNDVLKTAVRGIAELITCPGIINVDFADVRTVMSEKGMAIMGSGEATGENRAKEAAEKAISSPLLEDVDISGAKGILVNVTGGLDLEIGELDDVGSIITAIASQDATVVVGMVINPEMKAGSLRVTMVATGLGVNKTEEVLKPVAVAPSEGIKKEPQTAEINYEDLEKPAVTRRKEVAKNINIKESTDDNNMDDYDIPAFLRKQND